MYGIIFIDRGERMKFNTRELALQAMVAAVYVAVTFALQSVSFMAIQFRISEFLLILVLVNKKNAIGIIIGTLLANTFSDAGLIDVVVGTFATFLALQVMIYSKNKWVQYLAPAVLNGIIIGIMLWAVFDLRLVINMVSVFVSEVVVTFVPWVLMGKYIFENESIQEIFE